MTPIKTIIVFVFFAILTTGSVKGQNSTLSDEYVRLAEDSKKNMKQDDAIIYYEKASVEFQTLGNIEQFINSYNQIGIILTRQDKYEKAKTYLEKALSTGLSLPDPDNLAVATTYISLGVVAAAEDQFEQSLDFHNKALKIRLLKLGKYSGEVATSYGNIGNVYFRKKDYDRAIEAHLIGKKIREKVFGKSSAEIVESYRGLGNAYREKKDYQKSLNFFEKALKNKIKQLGEGHKDLVRYYKYISEIHDLMGNKLKSDEYRIKAETIEKRPK